MTRTISMLSKFALAGSLSVMTGGAVGCYGEVDEGPPSAYVSSAQPVYYDGRPAYWYGGRWYYRDGGGRWGYYRSEPRYLHDYRVRTTVHVSGPPRRYEEEHRR